MDNDINHILATKRAWRTSERLGQDRRIKDGSFEDRKNAAIAIKEGRKQQPKITWWRRILNSLSFVFFLIILCPTVQAQEILYTDTQLVNAIFLTEGGYHAQYPYGIRSVQCSSLQDCRRICLNTIRHNRKRYVHQRPRMEFIAYLGSRYCPTTGKNLSRKEKEVNKNWIKNLKYFLLNSVTMRGQRDMPSYDHD